MQPQTKGREVEKPVGLDRDARFRGKYISLTSFKRSGAAVATPVWFVVEDRQLLGLTGSQSFKAKRIRRNPRVMVAPCSAGGRLRSDPVSARAEILPQSELDRVDQLMTRKYRTDRIVVPCQESPAPRRQQALCLDRAAAIGRHQGSPLPISRGPASSAPPMRT